LTTTIGGLDVVIAFSLGVCVGGVMLLALFLWMHWRQG
jgi:hypothetical protein